MRYLSGGYVKARIEHECDGCNEKILPGQRYHRDNYVDKIYRRHFVDEHFVVTKLCEECNEHLKKHSEDYDDGEFDKGQLRHDGLVYSVPEIDPAEKRYRIRRLGAPDYRSETIRIERRAIGPDRRNFLKDTDG